VIGDRVDMGHNVQMTVNKEVVIEEEVNMASRRPNLRFRCATPRCWRPACPEPLRLSMRSSRFASAARPDCAALTRAGFLYVGI